MVYIDLINVFGHISVRFLLGLRIVVLSYLFLFGMWILELNKHRPLTSATLDTFSTLSVFATSRTSSV